MGHPTANGLSLIVFPEGTRSRLGQVQGRQHHAGHAGLPIVPISVIGSRHVMKKGELTRPGHVTAIVDDPIETPANAVHEVREFADRVRK